MQYAHARVAAVLRNAADLGLSTAETSHPELLTHETEGELLARARRVPARGRQAAAELREPHRVARYLEELAGTYHRFYDTCRVLPMRRRGDRRPAPGPAAARRRDPQVLANGLGLLGVSAPERM